MSFHLVSGLNSVGEIVSIIIFGLYSMVAAAGGVGGGPMYSSVLIAFNATAHTAIPIAKAVIFAGSFSLIWFNIASKSASDKRKPGIMWDLVFFIENSVMMGAVFGSVLNAILPEWFLIYSEIIFFTYEGINTLRKGIDQIKKDRAKFSGKQHVQMKDILQAEGATGLVEEVSREKISPCSHWKYVNKARFASFFIFIALNTSFTVARVFVKKCSFYYWGLLGLNFIFGILAIVVNDTLLHKSFKKNDPTILLGSSNPAFHTNAGRIKYSLIGFLAGAMAAALGLGGGIILTPLMLSMGVSPYTTRVASSSMIFFTSFTSALQYAILGQLVLDQVWVLVIVVAVMYPLGYYLSEPLIRLVRSTSVIQVLMAVGILASDIFVIIYGVRLTAGIIKAGMLAGLNNICK